MAVIFASAVVVLLVFCHINVVGVEVRGHAQIVATVLQKMPALFLPFRDPRLDEKLENLSISLNLWSARAFIHVQIFILATLLFYACSTPTLCSLSRVLPFALLYVNSLEMIFKGSRLSARRIRTMYVSVMAIFFVRALLPAWSAEHSGFDQLDMVVAIGCGVASLSCRTAMLPLVMIFVADSWSKSMARGYSFLDTFVANGQRCLCSAAVVVLVEQLARAMIVSELDTQETLEAFRGIVRCCMDADVMLDSQFRIRDRATSLELLLHRQDELSGMSFLDLLSSDASTQEFLNLAERSIEQATSGQQVAPVARLGLKRASGGLARGDVYMVHILAREVVDISLFLDGQTEWFDVKEARIRFTRFEDRGSGMPTLKHMMLPSEWPSTLPKLQEAVWSALGTDIGFVPQALGPLHVRMPEILAEGNGRNLSLLARNSQLRLVQGANINQDGSDLSVQPIYLCLQLYNFVQLDRRGRPVELGAVSEFSSMQSEAAEQ
ncbi:unnamed protein product [Symbiodinium sp. KB8]|nr:unnamed protein product [Symbiodinium sp. KB8]